MLKKTLTHIKRAFSHTYFKRIILCYLSTLCIFFFLFSVFITYAINEDYKNEMIQLNENHLKQSDDVSKLILGDILQFSYTEYNSNADLIHLMYSDEFSLHSSMKTSALMQKLMSYSNLVDSYYIINSSAGYVCTSYSTMKRTADFEDQDILQWLEQHVPSSAPAMFIPRKVTQAENKRNLISIVYHQSTNGAFVVNIDQLAFASILSDSGNSDLVKTIVVNRYGQVIAHENPDMFELDYTQNHVYSKIAALEIPAGTFTQRISNHNHYVSYRQNHNSGLTFIKLTKNLMLDTNNSLLVKAIINAVAFMTGGFFICFFLSFFLYKPIQKLHTSLSSYIPQDTLHGDEFQQISQSYLSIYEQNKALHQSAWIYKSAARSKSVKLLLDTGFASIAPMQNTNHKLDLNLEGPNYLVCLLGIDIHSQNVNVKDDYPLILYAICNVVKELLEPYCTMEHAELTSNQLVCILNIKDDKSTLIVNSLKKAQEAISQYFETSFSAGIGNLVSELESVTESYKNSIVAFNHRFITGSGSINPYSNLQFVPEDKQIYPYSCEKLILASIKSLQIDDMHQSMDSFFNTVGSFHYNRIILYLLQLNLSAKQLEFQYELTADDQHDITELSFHTSSMKEVRQIFFDHGEAIIRALAEIRNNKSEKASVIHEVIILVDSNIYDASLSVDLLAQKVHLSVNYLRNIFKEHTGTSLSNYIIEKKLELICQLLVETDLSIQDISDKLGFTTKNYFFTFFKKHTGSTPNQYRKGAANPTRA